MGKRLARLLTAFLACCALVLSMSVTAWADEVRTLFYLVKASSLDLGQISESLNADDAGNPGDAQTVLFVGAAAQGFGVQSDVELRFSDVSLDDAGAFLSADVELAVSDAPVAALVAFVIDEDTVLVGPATGLAMRLGLDDGGLSWSRAEEVSDPAFEFDLPDVQELPDVQANVSELATSALDKLNDFYEGLKLSLPNLSFDGLDLHVPHIDLDDVSLSLPDIGSGADVGDVDVDDEVIDEYDFDDEDSFWDEWEDEPDITYYTVTFKDPDGRILDEQEVEYGGAAVEPKIPRRVDETFLYWDRDFSYVTGDIVVRAVYSGSVPSTGDPSAPLQALAALALLGLALCIPLMYTRTNVLRANCGRTK